MSRSNRCPHTSKTNSRRRTKGKRRRQPEEKDRGTIRKGIGTRTRTRTRTHIRNRYNCICSRSSRSAVRCSSVKKTTSIAGSAATFLHSLVLKPQMPLLRNIIVSRLLRDCSHDHLIDCIVCRNVSSFAFVKATDYATKPLVIKTA